MYQGYNWALRIQMISIIYVLDQEDKHSHRPLIAALQHQYFLLSNIDF